LKKIDKLRFELLVNCRITITEQLNQLMQEMNDRNHNANEAESTVLQCELDQYNEEIDKLSKQYGWRMEDLLLAAQAAQAKQEKQNMTSNIDIAQSNDNNSNKVTTPINNNVSKNENETKQNEITHEKSYEEIDKELQDANTFDKEIKKQLADIKQQSAQAIIDEHYDIAEQLKPKKKEIENKMKQNEQKIQNLQTQLLAMRPADTVSDIEKKENKDNKNTNDTINYDNNTNNDLNNNNNDDYHDNNHASNIENETNINKNNHNETITQNDNSININNNDNNNMQSENTHNQIADDVNNEYNNNNEDNNKDATSENITEPKEPQEMQDID